MVGSALGPALEQAGHQVVPLRRGVPGAGAHGPWWEPRQARFEWGDGTGWDAVVHLAGENIAGRWTPARKARIRDSRVQGTRLLSEALARLASPPAVLLCASATGFYGDRGAEWVDELSAPGSGFLADVCREWEAAAAPAAALGIRVAHLRLGVVLTRAGGALAKMLPVFRAGLGGCFGSGRQFWSWVVIEDAVGAFLHALGSDRLSGPINVVSPQPVMNLEFTRTLGAALKRPACCPVPAFAVRLFFGEMGEATLLSSARVRPARLEQSGYSFKHPGLEEALRALLI